MRNFQEIFETRKWSFINAFLFSENDFETVLATFCCDDHGPKACYYLLFIICWIGKIYLSINKKLWKKVGS